MTMQRLRREAAVSVVELVPGFVVIVHFGQDGDAALAAAAMEVLCEFRGKSPNDAGNDQGMFRGQEAAIAARSVR